MLQSEQTKGKSAGKVRTATKELQYLMNFNASITHCMAKSMEHLSDCFCLHGIRCPAPLDLPTLFPDTVLRKAEEDISKFEDRGRSLTQSVGHKGQLVPLLWSRASAAIIGYL